MYYYNNSYNNSNGGFGGGGATTKIGTGWALGAGAEYMFAKGWSFKVEYLYTSIGSLTTPNTLGSSNFYGSGYGYGNTGTYPYSYSSSSLSNGQSVIIGNAHIPSIGVHQARFGLNYHTDWLSTPSASLR